MNDLHQCTFSPEISSKKVSEHYLKNKSQIKPIKRHFFGNKEKDNELCKLKINNQL